jgi:type 1 glutamine amidotransferase
MLRSSAARVGWIASVLGIGVVVIAAAAARPCAMATTPAAPPAAPKVVVVTAEEEYDAKTTLPAFVKADVESRLGVRATFLNSDSKTEIQGLEALDDADLLVLFVRRRTLPDAQLGRIKAYLDRGKPLVALRTSCHAFQDWKTFDHDVLGCNYQGHHGKDLKITVRPAPGAENTPLLRGVVGYESGASLYKVNPLAKTATPLLVGKVADQPEEPVAWTNAYKGGRVFFTSLGHQDDFKSPAFRRLLLNGITWALGRATPEK